MPGHDSGRRRHRARQLRHAGPRRATPLRIRLSQHGRRRAQHRRSRGFDAAWRSPMRAAGKRVPRARRQLRARLLEHDDPLSLPGTAGGAEGGAASAGEDPAGLYQRRACATGAPSTSSASPDSSPGGYFTSMMLNWPVDIGGYSGRARPTSPCCCSWCARRQAPACRSATSIGPGRVELLATSFETFERTSASSSLRACWGMPASIRRGTSPPSP